MAQCTICDADWQPECVEHPVVMPKAGRPRHAKPSQRALAARAAREGAHQAPTPAGGPLAQAIERSGGRNPYAEPAS